MKNDLVSVIIPVYNVEKYLCECLDSIINQTYRNIQIILVDDGSTDNSANICDEYKMKDERITVIHKLNEGLSSARNKGLENAKGAYIQFVDSDDYIDLDTIEIMHNIICKCNADIVSYSHYILNNGKIISNCTKEIEQIEKIEVMKEIMLDDKVRNYSWEKLWKKELFKDITYPIGRKFEDLLTTPLILEKAEKIVVYDIPKYYYRQRNDSIMGKQCNKLRIEYIRAVCEMNKYLKEKYPEIEKYLNYNIVNMTLNTYNDIAIFAMYDLLEEDIVKQIYSMATTILKDDKNKEFIKKQSSKEKYTHIEILMNDKKKYYEQHIRLPVIYPEHIGKEKGVDNKKLEKYFI